MEREYKDSGIEWIGRIPKEWKACRLKSLGFLYGGLVGKSGNDFDVEDGDRYSLYIPFTNIFNNDVIDPDNLHKVKSIEGETQNEVKEGDLLFLMSSEDFDGIGKPSILQSTITQLYLNSFCKGFRITNKNVIPKFLFYLMASHFVREQLRLEAKGFIRINLRQDRLLCCELLFPPKNEQQRIANYLDKKCGEIDGLIGLQEQMIEQLTAYKQSVITEAVTKGLNPNAHLVPSGIDWIGDVPEGWKISKTLYALQMPITDGPHETPELFADGIPFISADAISDGFINFANKRGYISNAYYRECCKKYIPQKYDVYMIKSGASTGRTAIVETDDIFTIWSPLAVFRVNPNIINPYYLLYSLRSNYYQRQVQDNWSYGTQQNIGMRTLEKLLLIIPSLPEQQTIVQYLDTKCAEIDTLVALKQKKIETLKDYKKSIIYEAVTGKIEIV